MIHHRRVGVKQGWKGKQAAISRRKPRKCIFFSFYSKEGKGIVLSHWCKRTLQRDFVAGRCVSCNTVQAAKNTYVNSTGALRIVYWGVTAHWQVTQIKIQYQCKLHHSNILATSHQILASGIPFAPARYHINYTTTKRKHDTCQCTLARHSWVRQYT